MYLRDLNKRIKDFGWDLSRASGRKNTRWLVSCLSGSEYKKYCKIKTDLKNLSEKHFLITPITYLVMFGCIENTILR
jgi:hypothetical protein